MVRHPIAALLLAITMALLAACRPATPEPDTPADESSAPSPTAAVPQVTTRTPTPTQTLNPTSTPTRALTATFDAASALTVTPAAPAECPAEDPGLAAPTFTLPAQPIGRESFDGIYQSILDFLNAGGTRRAVVDALRRTGISMEDGTDFMERDLTNDGQPELLVSVNHLLIYTCKDGQYYEAAKLKPYTFVPPNVIATEDMNLNGISEIVVHRPEDQTIDVENDYQILEWDGQRFQNLVAPGSQESRYQYEYYYIRIEDGWIAVFGRGQPDSNSWEVRDIDGNGTLEFVIHHGISVRHPQYGPWRAEMTTFIWNGNRFVWYRTEFEPPRYRFQAVQDADVAVLEGRYDEALQLYEQVISSDSLEGWSQERYDTQAFLAWGIEAPTPPALDPQERGNLTAYARYRMMLLHLLRERLPEAEAIYNALQQEHRAGESGHAYAEMALAFWTELQISQSVPRACQQAVDYAGKYGQEILYYLGEYHHGAQSLNYQPEDICPFE